MEDDLWFLVHSYETRQAKTYYPDGRIDSYPGSKTMDSRKKSVPFTPDGLRKKHDLMRAFAGRTGGAMMKGPMVKEFQKESRSGLTDTTAPTRTIVFDFDDLVLKEVHIPSKMTAASLQLIAERAVQELPEEFWNVSYIATASSSFGMKKNVIGLHLDFWLEEEISPRQLKDYLRWLNFRLPTFEEQITLNAGGRNLSYRIDPCMAENSRMLYIAAPNFADPAMNPFENDKDRLILVEKQNLCVDLRGELLQMSNENLEGQRIRMLKHLNKAKGEKYVEAKTRKINVMGRATKVTINPVNRPLTFKFDHGDYCSFSIMPKDNNAYLVNKERPAVVYSMLPDEDPFLFEQADPEGYEWFVNEYVAKQREEEAVKKPDGCGVTSHRRIPISYLERNSDQYFYGYLLPDKDQLIKMQITAKKQEIDSWYEAEGHHKPDFTLFAEHQFQPDNPVRMDLSDPNNGFINTFKPNDMLYQPPEIPAKFHGARTETACEHLSELCPTIYQCIRHATASKEEAAYFINWLAFILKLRKKTKTSYLLQGTQGTGKGVIYSRILKPLLGDHIKKTTVDLLTEKFTDYVEDCLILVVDEFNFEHSKEAKKVNAKLKELTTEDYIAHRAFKKRAETILNYINILYLSNEQTSTKVENNDRRINVCPRQEIPIATAFPDWPEQMDALDKEVPFFNTFCQLFEVNEKQANTARDSEAKKQLADRGKTSIEEFTDAINNGDIHYFTEILNLPRSTSNYTEMNTCKNLIGCWLKDHARDNPSAVFATELMAFYTVLIGPIDGIKKFGRLLNKNNVPTDKVFRNPHRQSGVKIKWNMSDTDRAALQKQLNNPLASNEDDSEYPRALPE